MFAGIGGFRSGLSKFGDFFVPVGFCEIDPFARRAYLSPPKNNTCQSAANLSAPLVMIQRIKTAQRARSNTHASKRYTSGLKTLTSSA